MVPLMSRRPLSTFALIGALAVALSVAACGRKSGLDLPPSASAAPSPAETAAKQESDVKTLTSPMARPPKPQPRVVPQRSLPIDVLLN
jgi:predicted small lipoprotein YifL